MAANQIQYSLLDRRPELRMNDFCAATGMRLLPYGVVAGGFLSDAYIVRCATASRRPARQLARSLDPRRRKCRIRPGACL